MFNFKSVIGLYAAVLLSAPVSAIAASSIPSDASSQSIGAIAGPAGAVSALSHAHAGTSSPDAMVFGPATFAPKGYVEFCARSPDQCGLVGMSAEDRANLAQSLNREGWARIFQLDPKSIRPPVDEPVVAMPFEYDDVPNAVGPIAPDDDDTFAETGDAAAQISDRAPGDGTTVIPFTPSVWATLNIVNQSINRRITPESDEAAFGQSDYWTLPLSEGGQGMGNCKHYVLEKRKALVEAGLPAAALSIAIVRTAWGEVHAVLIADTDKGELVLDNLTPTIKGWRQAPYTWLSRQTPGRPLEWVALNTAASR